MSEGVYSQWDSTYAKTVQFWEAADLIKDITTKPVVQEPIYYESKWDLV